MSTADPAAVSVALPWLIHVHADSDGGTVIAGPSQYELAPDVKYCPVVPIPLPPNGMYCPHASPANTSAEKIALVIMPI